MIQYTKTFARGIYPRKNLTVSQWADANRVLSSKSSSEPGNWRTSRVPYTREIMDNLSASDLVQRIVLMFAAQSSKTEIALCWLGYIMEHAPAPTLVVVPTLEVRKRWVKQRLNPMLTWQKSLMQSAPETPATLKTSKIFPVVSWLSVAQTVRLPCHRCRSGMSFVMK